MKIKKDDNVIVITGKDKGKTGKVLHAFPALDKVIVAGMNIKKIHKKAKKSNEKGQIIEQAAPMHVSNVMIVDPKTQKPTRVGYDKKGDKKVRIAKKSGASIDK